MIAVVPVVQQPDNTLPPSSLPTALDEDLEERQVSSFGPSESKADADGGDVMDKLGSLHDMLEHVSERIDVLYDEMKAVKELSKRRRSLNNPAPGRSSILKGSELFTNSSQSNGHVPHMHFRISTAEDTARTAESGTLEASTGNSTHSIRSSLCAQAAAVMNTGLTIPEQSCGHKRATLKPPEPSDMAPRSSTGSRKSTANGAGREASRREAFNCGNSFRGQTDASQIHKLMKMGVRRYEVLEDIWNFLDDSDSSIAAKYFTKALCYLILLSVFIPFLQSMKEPPLPDIVAAVFEMTFDSIFSIIILLRLVSCPSKLKFFQSPTNWIDMCAFGSLGVRASLGFVLASSDRDTARGLILMCLVPVLRLLKMVRHFETFQILLGAFSLALEALPVLLYMLGVIMLASSSCIYAFEPRENIQSFPMAMWLSIVTITTVGYGDVTPETNAGHVVVSALVLSSVLFMAMPLGIIGSAFNITWNDRDRILLMQRTRRRLVQWGYTANDILVLFELVDLDGDGRLNFEECVRFALHT